ncbi:uncharacterized protein K444DRAFT_29930 [Hyaloscypha bicolor E]|uniref:EGF-like domain-containing protein n=1 Tax=Hyaloscypha bicolor E TaxID=1095630 RepID=A0A2J6T3E1_9HELO|nr:uncharacterized protein K444DRAFT_29930 [Hyaloscypha bicolor E]PMD57550.1 hypothetical protein K444DRAFT_29930 [Hyaloscypha bicolor E]
MQLTIFTLSVILGIATAMPGQNYYSTSDTHTITNPVPSYVTETFSWHPVPTSSSWYPPGHGDCGDKCGGVCGDHIVQYPEEECDLGPELNGKPGSGCDAHCHKCGYCGDYITETQLGETCDLGPLLNGKPGSGCSADCKCLPVCGNGKVEKGEECDAGPLNGVYGSGCSKDCQLCGYCGDGKIDDEAGEQCDNGYLLNGTPGNPCSANCTLNTCEYKCGNGIVEPGEQCDDGPNNGKKGDKCSSKCEWVDCSCGNGITEWPELCDDGDLNGSNSSYCTIDCKWKEDCGNPHPPTCGDGIVQWPETCDMGWRNGQPGSNCSTDCQPCDSSPPKCGDGHKDPGEECDDGSLNGTPSSDCDATCHSKCSSTCPQTCNPNPFFNKCTISTCCINTPSQNDFCACRPGYRASGLKPDDPKQFRLAFAGQEHRVFVEPGVECDQPCDPGASCGEVPVRGDC